MWKMGGSYGPILRQKVTIFLQFPMFVCYFGFVFTITSDIDSTGTFIWGCSIPKSKLQGMFMNDLLCWLICIDYMIKNIYFVLELMTKLLSNVMARKLSQTLIPPYMRMSLEQMHHQAMCWNKILI